MVTTIYNGEVLERWESELLSGWMEQMRGFQPNPIFVQQVFS